LEEEEESLQATQFQYKKEVHAKQSQCPLKDTSNM
jgi:hypothetical protein